MKLSLLRVCNAFFDSGRNAPWEFFTNIKELKSYAEDCENIYKKFFNPIPKMEQIDCSLCKNKIIDISELDIKPERMKEFLFWYIKNRKE